MLGETISIIRDGVTVVLPRLNQDNFTSLYQTRNGTEEFRVIVRHATETAKAGIVPFERHNIEFIHVTFATPTTLEREERSTFTIRNRRSDDPEVAKKSAKALLGFLTDANLAKLIAWES